MKLRQLYTEFIRLYLSKTGERIIEIVTKKEDRPYRWFTDGTSVWIIPKDNPFDVDSTPNEWVESKMKEGVDVAKITRSPYPEDKNIIKLEAEDKDLYMYINEAKLKWYDKDLELKILESDRGLYGRVCQVYENDEIRGVILGIRISEGKEF